MSRVIPKEHLTAYQRWELGAMEPPARADDGAPDGADASSETIDTEVVLPTAEDIERLHQEAWREGYAMGFEEGRRAGMEQGTREAVVYTRRLAEITEALEAERVAQDEQLAREVLDLALVVARQMLRAALFVKEDLLLEVIREALANLPSLSGPMQLMVHPDDVVQVREWLTTEQGHGNIRVVGDPNLEHGGFRFLSPNSEMDGNIASRWREIVACLGTDVRWLE
jgi:flagellar assembly protein FliH